MTLGQHTNHNSYRIQDEEEGVGQVSEQQRQTWLSVSPFIHQHLKRGTMQLSSVCWTVLSFLSPQCGEKSVCFWKLQRGFGCMKRGKSIYFTLYRSIYYFLVASETKCLLYGIRGVGDGKKKQKKNKSQKSSGPKRGDANAAIFVEVQVLGRVDHRRSNGQSGARGQICQKNGNREMFCWAFLC